MQEPQRKLLSLMWILQSHHQLLCQRASWCMSGTDGEKMKLKLDCNPNDLDSVVEIWSMWHRNSYTHLSVHEDIDNWVVNGGTLGKVCRHGSSQRMKGISWVSRGKTGKNGVWSPADTICHDHDNNHPGYFSLSFLGWFWFLLLHGNLGMTNRHSEQVCDCGLALIPCETAGKMTYSTDSTPHCKVAQYDDGQRNEATCNHENNHIGLDSRVFTSAEYIRSTGSFQPMRPVSEGRKTFSSPFHWQTRCSIFQS